MKKALILLIGFLYALQGYAQSPLTNETLNSIVNLTKDQQDKLDAARTVADAVEKAGNYIKSISDLLTNGTIPLPVGIKKGDYSLIIREITWDPKTEEPSIFASCAFKFKDSGQLIAFEGRTVLKGTSGLDTKGRLELVAPVRRDIGKESALIVHEGTAVNFGCEGIESFDAKLSWVTTSQTIVAVDATGNPTNRPLQTTFATTFRNFDNYSASLNIDQSFCIKGLKDVIFTLKGATLDQSDIETSVMVKFPANYFSKSTPEIIALWKGLYISEASVSLPPIFKKSESNERLTVSLQGALFDENGFTGHVEAKNLPPNGDLWDISLTNFSLGILKNSVVDFGFGGKLNVPPLEKNCCTPAWLLPIP